MIVTSLYDLYERYIEDPEMQDRVPLEGMSLEKVEWELVLSEAGELLNIVSMSHGDGKGVNRFREMLVPEHDGRSGTKPKPYFLCDTAAYLLGVSDDKRAAEKREAAAALHKKVLSGCYSPTARAVLGFFSHDLSERECEILREYEESLSGNLVFAIRGFSGETFRAHKSPDAINAWNSHCRVHGDTSITGQCSVTGEIKPLARLFPQVTGLAGAQSSGASLVSFNCDSFNSYGRSQAYNASISERAAFGSGSALKMLLADPKRRVRLGDTVFTFWSDRPAPDEDDLIMQFFGGQDAAEDPATVDRVHDALEDIKAGLPLGEGFNPDVRYYVLGISPNAARLSVRFFETAMLGELAEHHGQYLRDVGVKDVRATSLFQLIRQCAIQGKYENIPSTLVNPCVQAMLMGSRFPRSLLSTLLSRMRADHGSNNAWDTGQRASLIKACLVRDRRFRGIPITRGSEIGMALNRENTHTGYLLGRLFAVMERAQSAALGTTNATIRDKYIGSASVTPARVMPTLMHGCQNHLSELRKKNPGLNVLLEKELDEIVGKMLSDKSYPSTLSMEEQGEFFVGYYQERVDLWTPHKQDDALSNRTASDNPNEN